MFLWTNASIHSLVAFVVFDQSFEDHAQTEVISRTLKEALTARLPQYMVPNRFEILDKMPLTPNGKIDRRALHQLMERERQPATSTIGLSVELDRLANLWQDVLGVRPTGPEDNFFDLGAIR